MSNTAPIATYDTNSPLDRYLAPAPPRATPTIENVCVRLTGEVRSVRSHQWEAEREWGLAVTRAYKAREQPFPETSTESERTAYTQRAEGLRAQVNRLRTELPPLVLTGPRQVLSAQLVEKAHEVLHAVTSNPDWMRATARRGTAQHTDARQVLRERLEVQEAKKLVCERQRAVTAALEEFRRFEAQPKWLASTREALFGEKARVAEAIGNAVKTRTLAEAELKRVEERLLPECAAEARVENVRARAIERRAEADQERLERPLRSALVSMAVAADILQEGRATASLHANLPPSALEFCGIHERRGLAVAAFRGPDGQHYLADAITIKPELERLALTPGDRVTASIAGLQLEERGPHLQVASELVTGRIERLEWQGCKLAAVALSTDQGLRLLVPARGDDLQKELPPHLTAHVAPGAELKLSRGQVAEVAAPTRARGRS